MTPQSGSYGFPPGLRVRKRSDYRRIQDHGKRIRSRHLVVLYLPSSTVGHRFGITVSRKVGGAVVRNRVKRWLREAIRHEHHALGGELDVVFIARTSAADAGALVLRREVSKVFRRLTHEAS